MLSFFFFQAEDGIRGYKVTGVQTCALPILVAQRAQVGQAVAAVGEREREVAQHAARIVARAPLAQALKRVRERSEERRVGKECRDRWTQELCQKAIVNN